MERRGKGRADASYIDISRCKLPDCDQCALNDASDEWATHTFGHLVLLIRSVRSFSWDAREMRERCAEQLRVADYWSVVKNGHNVSGSTCVVVLCERVRSFGDYLSPVTRQCGTNMAGSLGSGYPKLAEGFRIRVCNTLTAFSC